MNDKPSILMITHVVPCPPAAGNEIRILKLLNWLRGEGFSTIFLLNGRFKPDSRRALEEVVDSVHLIEDEVPDIDTAGLKAQDRLNETVRIKFKSMANAFLNRFSRPKSKEVEESLAPERLKIHTRVLCERYKPVAVIAEYIFTSPCLDMVPPNVIKFIDTHDMFSRKKTEVIDHGIDDPYYCTPNQERAYLLKSDVVIAIQSREAEMFRKLVPEREVITMGIDYDVVEKIDNAEVKPGTILVVGSDNPLNVHGLKEFLRHAWPVIRNKVPEAVLRVVGKLGKHVETEDERVQAEGWVESIDDEYRKAAVVINPTVAGTGLKIKTVEALCRAKPLVTTVNGADGLSFKEEPPLIICKNWEEFSSAVISLLGSESKRVDLQKRALEYAKACFGTEQVYAELSRVLKSRLEKPRPSFLL